MKVGDRGFICTNENTHLYVEVEGISPNILDLIVINGAYNMSLHIVDVPDNVYTDYNTAIDWYNDQLSRPKSENEQHKRPSNREVDDEIPF